MSQSTEQPAVSRRKLMKAGAWAAPAIAVAVAAPAASATVTPQVTSAATLSSSKTGNMVTWTFTVSGVSLAGVSGTLNFERPKQGGVDTHSTGANIVENGSGWTISFSYSTNNVSGSGWTARVTFEHASTGELGTFPPLDQDPFPVP